MNAILSAVLPVALIISIGYVAGKNLKLDISTLSVLSVYILAPALVINSLYRTQVSGNNVLLLLLAYTVISVILYGIVWTIALLLKFSDDDRRSLFAITLSPNNGNMGLSIIAFALGDGGLERAIIYMIGSSIFLFGILPAILKGGSIGQSLNLTWKLPLFWSIVIGFALHWLKIQLPFNLDKSIEWLGVAAIPMALIILGMQLQQTKFSFSLPEMGFSVVKLTIAPCVAYGVALAFNLTGLDLQVLVLQTCMPTAVNTLVIAQEFGGNVNMIAKTIIISTLFSFATIPVVIGLVT
jgi:malate permease and related proteins